MTLIDRSPSSILHALERYLGNFTDSFEMALVLWPLLSVALTLPILAIQYHRNGHLRFTGIIATYLAVLYILGLGCFTLYPLPSGTSGYGITMGIPWETNPMHFVTDIRNHGWHAVAQLAFNVVLFMPLGYIAGRGLRWGPIRSILLGCAISCCIELTQGTGLWGHYAYSYRTCDIDDVITNTTGAFVGWFCAAIVNLVIKPHELADETALTADPGRIRRFVALCIDALLALAIGVVVEGGINVALELNGMDAFIDGDWMTLVSVAIFLLIEGALPWFHGGSTPGGSFVRMTFEGKPRTTRMRAMYYVVRLLFVGAAWMVEPFLWIAYGLFCLVTKKLPWDYLPER